MTDTRVFHISALVRLTLLSLYAALTLPLPFLARATAAAVPPMGLAIALAIGLLLLHGALSERVEIGDRGIGVSYPAWFPLRKGWFLCWEEIEALKPRTTGQGGLVYYFLSMSGEAYLLPMRIAGFTRLVERVQEKTGIDTRDVKPLAQPWMYLILLGCTILLLAVDAWTIATAIALGRSPII